MQTWPISVDTGCMGVFQGQKMRRLSVWKALKAEESQFNRQLQYFEFAVNARMQFIEHVEVHVQGMQTTISRGSLILNLHQRSTDITSRLMERHTADRRHGIQDWTFTSVRHWGSSFNSEGDDERWTLTTNVTALH